MKQANELYREKISFVWGWLVTGLLLASTAAALAFFFIHRTRGPVGDNPAPDWVYLAIAVCFFACGLLTHCFIHLTVKMDPQGVTAGYGPFRHFEPWGNIAGVEQDKSAGILSYGGYGLRFVRKRSGWMLIYNVIGAPVLLLELKEGKKKYFGFSTKHPDEIATLINSWKH